MSYPSGRSCDVYNHMFMPVTSHRWTILLPIHILKYLLCPLLQWLRLTFIPPPGIPPHRLLTQEVCVCVCMRACVCVLALLDSCHCRSTRNKGGWRQRGHFHSSKNTVKSIWMISLLYWTQAGVHCPPPPPPPPSSPLSSLTTPTLSQGTDEEIYSEWSPC